MFFSFALFMNLILTGIFATEGGKKSGRTSFQRSEEVGAAADMRTRFTRQASKDSNDGRGSANSLSSADSSNA